MIDASCANLFKVDNNESNENVAVLADSTETI